ncbi:MULTISPECIES: ferric iron reductase [Gracilibacillus]|uniref:ferric iron reductase n=1 Tax=Gracilibacillus TaxID=74385 RepID=UPI00082582AE|nr:MULTISPECIES: ferric iron reductase [Gracilibacillus]
MLNLERFFIDQGNKVENGVWLIDIWQQSSCEDFLEELKQRWGASHSSIAASMLVKRLAVMMVSSTLYCMAVYQKAPEFTLHQLKWTNQNRLTSEDNQLGYKSVQHAEERQAKLQELLQQIISPLIELLHQQTRLKKTILWENVAVRIASINRKMKQEELPICSINRFQKDLIFLSDQQSPLVEGINPLANYLSSEEGEQWRKTCCLYHQLDKNKGKGIYCVLCPLK